MVAAADQRLAEVDRVGTLGVIGPAGEGVALAGRGQGLAGDTVGIGYALERLVAVEERAAVGNVKDIDSLVLLRRRPSGEKGHIFAATDNRLVEVNLIGSIAVIIPTGKHIAVTRRSKRLTSNTIAVSLTPHKVVAVGELTAIGRVGHIKRLRGSLSPLGEQNIVAGAAQKRLR